MRAGTDFPGERQHEEGGHPPAGFDLPFRNVRFALLVGFGSLLLAMALTGGDALIVLRQVRREDDVIRRQFLFRNHTLNEVRSDLYLSGTWVRDYLLEPEPARAESFRSSLEDVRGRMQSALNAYGREVNVEERPQYAALTGELSRYWDVLGPIMRWDAAERPRPRIHVSAGRCFPPARRHAGHRGPHRGHQRTAVERRQ